MQKRKISWRAGLGLALLGGVALAGVALAGPRGGEACAGHGGPTKGLEHRFEKLDLDPEARASIDAIFDASRDERRALHREAHSARERLHELLRQDAPDAEAVLAQAESLGALQTEARKLELRALLAVRDVVSPAQWETLRESAEHGGRGHRFGRHGRHASERPL